MKLQKLTEETIGSDVINKISNTDDAYMVILIGPPNSGKSTFTNKIKALRDDVEVCSTDDFFMRNGKYVFDVSKLGSNHQKNFQKSINAMKRHHSIVVIDNTNLSTADFKEYVKAANTYSYKVLFKIFQVDREELIRRTVQRQKETGKEIGVDVIDRMLNKMNENIKSIQDFINKYNAGQYPFVLEKQEDRKKMIYVGIFFQPEQLLELNKKFRLNIRPTRIISNPHITLFYNKLKNFTNLVKDVEFGKIVNVKIDKYWEEKSTGHGAFVCEINEPIITESQPHITMVLGEGKKPYYTNEMINRDRNIEKTSIGQIIKGRIGYFDGEEVKYK